jgi:hypothetical protein
MEPTHTYKPDGVDMGNPTIKTKPVVFQGPAVIYDSHAKKVEFVSNALEKQIAVRREMNSSDAGSIRSNRAVSSAGTHHDATDLRIENIEITKDHILATDTTHTAIELVLDPDYTRTLVKDLGRLNVEAEKRYQEDLAATFVLFRMFKESAARKKGIPGFVNIIYLVNSVGEDKGLFHTEPVLDVVAVDFRLALPDLLKTRSTKNAPNGLLEGLGEDFLQKRRDMLMNVFFKPQKLNVNLKGNSGRASEFITLVRSYVNPDLSKYNKTQILRDYLGGKSA